MYGSPHNIAVHATLHCLTGCAIGEILGMVISTALGWGAATSIGLSVLLAFIFGYALTMRPLLVHGLSVRRAMGLALVADTASIAVMEIVDNGFILLVPGAIHSGLVTGLFWTSLLASLTVAFVAAHPLNRWLIARGKGHATLHQHRDH